jgi:hypothetical protein
MIRTDKEAGSQRFSRATPYICRRDIFRPPVRESRSPLRSRVNHPRARNAPEHRRELWKAVVRRVKGG